MKKVYVSPAIIVRGTIEDITQGSGFGIRDFFVFGINDAIGQTGCRNNSCVRHS